MSTDICTLVTSAATAIACFAPHTCDTKVIDGQQLMLCRPGAPIPCNSTVEGYVCKRDDGSTYPRIITVPPTGAR